MPERFRRFCGPTVPLVRLKKRTWDGDTMLTAEAEVAHFGPSDLRPAPCPSGASTTNAVARLLAVRFLQRLFAPAA